MTDITPRKDRESTRIVLGLLQSVERNGSQSQRTRASELGIALGLVNAYLKRCVKKGLLKISQAPPHRYAYYLTPTGLSEKSRLTAEYLSHSFDFFRRARADCAAVLAEAAARGWSRIALVGISDLTEIAVICATETGLDIVALVDAAQAGGRRLAIRIVATVSDIAPKPDGLIVTGVHDAAALRAAAATSVGTDRVLIPELIGLASVRPRDDAETSGAAAASQQRGGS